MNLTDEKEQKHKKNENKNGKACYKLISNSVYSKVMENSRNRIYVKLVTNKKDFLKWISKPSYMWHKIFDNDLVTILKNKLSYINA